MGDSTIHDLPAASSVAATDVIPIDQGLNTVKATMQQVANVVGPINVGVGIHNANAKTTPIDPDELGIVDTADGNTLKKLTWANLKATLGGIFTTIASLAASGGSALVGFLQAGTGAVARTVQSKEREIISVKDFGAIGDGVTDDTVAIQAAIDYILTIRGELHFPVGDYVISNTLQIYSFYASVGVKITGAGGGYLGSRILWKGNAPSGYIIHFRGCNFTIFENLVIQCFDNLSNYPYLGAIFVQTAQGVGGAASSGVCLRDLIVVGGIGTGSFAIRLGNNTQQVSEIECLRVRTAAGVDGTSTRVTEYGFIINNGNTKDMTFIDCSQGYYTVAGVYYESGTSGWHIWLNLGGGPSACDFMINGIGSLKIIGGGSEGSTKFIDQISGGANFGTIQVYGYQLEGCTGIEMITLGQCSIELEGCTFTRSAGSTPMYIKVPDGGLSSGSANALNTVISRNNFYQFASDIVPIKSFGYFIETYFASQTWAPIRVYSNGDTGGTLGALIQLKSVFGQKPIRFETTSFPANNWVSRALPYKTYTPSIPVTVNKYTVDYTFLIDATNAFNMGIINVAAGGKIIGAYANITTAFTLGASNITMSLGNVAGPITELLKATSISAGTGVIGAANADLGSWLAIASIVQGGYVNLNAATNIYARFISSAGNFGNGTVTNLTTGSVDIYIVVQDLF